MQDAVRERDRLRAERERIQHRLAALDNPTVAPDQDAEPDRESLAARLTEIDRELEPLDEQFDQLPPDQRPT